MAGLHAYQKGPSALKSTFKMFSLAKCKEILGENAGSLSDEEILRIRNDLYALARIALEMAADDIKNGKPPVPVNKGAWR